MPTTWDLFKAVVVKEFVPDDHVRRARDKLRKLKQTSSVSKYLSEFRNVVLTVPDVTDGEKWDKFCAGLKYEIRLEVMQSSVTNFEEAAQIALRVDSALWSASNFPDNKPAGSSSGDAPTPMEIGNMERSPLGAPRQPMTPQRLRDLRSNACFTCHKVGCRPWKHKKNAVISNVEVGDDESREGDDSARDISDSEN